MKCPTSPPAPNAPRCSRPLRISPDPIPVVVGVALFSGLFWLAVLGGDAKRRVITFASAGGATAAVLVYLSVVRWFKTPSLGIALIAVSAIGIALASALFLPSSGARLAGQASAGNGIVAIRW